jgi:hypothetical protein
MILQYFTLLTDGSGEHLFISRQSVHMVIPVVCGDAVLKLLVSCAQSK